jgi:ribose 5-phosphate isomerase A
MTTEAFAAVGRRALDYVPDGSVIGLGTGRAATAFVRALGERVRQGLRVRGVPTSEATAALARELGIPLASLDEVERLAAAIDGADEVDPRLDLIKGLGGALVREKIVAAAAERFVVVVGSEKLVPTLGSHGVIPVEVVPFALAPCRRRLTALGLRPEPRQRDGRLHVTDNGNHILDCGTGPIPDPATLDRTIRDVPGVVGTGLFLGMASVVLVQQGEIVDVRARS